MCNVFAKGGIEAEAIDVTAGGLEALQTEAERDVAMAVLRFPETIATAARTSGLSSSVSLADLRSNSVIGGKGSTT